MSAFGRKPTSSPTMAFRRSLLRIMEPGCACLVPAESSPICSALRTDAKLFDLLAMMSEVPVRLYKLTLEAVTLGWVLRIRQLALQDQNSLATGMNHAPMKGEVMPLRNFVCDGLTRCVIGHFHHHSSMSRENECR